ncbi:hypothetical protein OG543_21775 [Streptomyces sp. NBC_01178]|uniref:hypothetical protein n=1 Tax=Streptomyces sp. NBC_01178 TaxID=2903762 RepID=UPI00386497D8|nr:hypothetical protein OG543_21775 [Streptomyces sp. NBC_01178]
MRGDDGQRTDARPGDEFRERTGPRHAAPRKSLLTKLHLPSGKKALALAAMPTAVFVGMGLTPKLALADERIENPFAPGPCVTRSDEPSESASPEATPSPSATAEDGKDGASGKDGAAAPKPSAGGSAPGTEKDPAAGEKPGADTSARSADDQPAATPSATPTPTASKNPLDPLGIGDALKDLFDGPDDGKSEEPAAPSPSPTPEASEAPEAPRKSETPKDPAEDAADKAKETSDKTADAIREAAEKAGEKVEELDEDVKGLDPRKDEAIPDGAKPRFPCPEPDPDALAAAELEPDVPLLPSDPWILESTRLTLRGLDYHGIVEVRKADGSVKKVLKFTAASIDIKDLHQRTVGPAGTTGHVKSRPGSVSKIRDGEVTMYTEELKGNLFGVFPVTFSPQTPPPLNVPGAVFTKVRVVQAGQFGGTLTVPGLENYLEGGTG